MSKRILYLIRNGQSIQDAIDEPAYLTALGRQQAQLTAEALRSLPIATLYYSPDAHVTETAAIMGRADDSIHPTEAPTLRQYDTDDLFDLDMDLLNLGDDEQGQQLEAAYQAFFKPPPQDEELQEVLITHANVIRDLICRATGVSADTWAHMVIHHCSISTVSIDSDQIVALIGYNDVHHLPEHLRTGS